MHIWILIFLSLIANSVYANSVFHTFPEAIDNQNRYVFYSHGYIVEGGNKKPKHPVWGIYDFPSVIDSLSDKSYTLIAYHREEATDPFHYSVELATQVEKLLSMGVPQNNITLIGFSRGAFITSLASNHLANTPVNIILLAGCGTILNAKYQQIKIYGRFLSIYEKTDQAQSCQKLANRNEQLEGFTELMINTGKDHGAFYQPYNEWVKPLKDWIKSSSK